MTTCLACGEQIDDDAAAQMLAPLTGPDPLEHAYRQVSRNISREDTKTHNINHRRGRATLKP